MEPTQKLKNKLGLLRELVIDVGYDISEIGDWEPQLYGQIKHLNADVLNTEVINDIPIGGVGCFQQFSTPEGLLV